MDEKPKRGRPALHPPGTAGSDRAKLSRQALLAAGGVRLEVILPADCAQALADILLATGETSRTQAVSRLILAEAGRLERKKGHP
jgi:hypothetical protein